VKRILLIVVGVLVLAAMVVAGIKRGSAEKGAKIYVEPAKQRQISEVIKASGEIDPKEKVNISAHVVGKIENLYVKEGDEVRAGQPFLKLEQQAYIAARDQWAAQLRSAETGVRKAQVMLADAHVKRDRAQRLSQEGISTRQDLETAQLQEDSARLSLEDAREGVRQASANLVKARDDLAKTVIYSPLSGRVIKLNAEKGEVVVSGTMNNPGSVIGTIADLSEILAKVDVDETEIVDVAVGQSAVLKVDALSGREYHGRVVEVGSSGSTRAAQPDVTFFEVKIQMQDADAALRPGMSVRAEIRAATHQDAVVVPIQSVVERPPLAEEKPAQVAGKTATAAAQDDQDDQDAEDDDADEGDEQDEEVKVVFVVEEVKGKGGTQVHQRQVTTGISDETHVEVLSGLKRGERVVTGPYRTLRDLKDGQSVQVSRTTEAEDKKTAEDKDKER
jgi:HlyD family secretion protein